MRRGRECRGGKYWGSCLLSPLMTSFTLKFQCRGCVLLFVCREDKKRRNSFIFSPWSSMSGNMQNEEGIISDAITPTLWSAVFVLYALRFPHTIIMQISTCMHESMAQIYSDLLRISSLFRSCCSVAVVLSMYSVLLINHYQVKHRSWWRVKPHRRVHLLVCSWVSSSWKRRKNLIRSLVFHFSPFHLWLWMELMLFVDGV